MTRNKIGIFGGTFNPIHKAHKAIALEFIEKLSLDTLYIIPNNIPPLKNSHGVSGGDRIKMLELAFSGQERIVISDTELKRGGMSYTCDTVSEIKLAHPCDELFLLIGDDWIDRFDKWKNYKDITDMATLVVAYRGRRDTKSHAERISALTGKEILLLNNTEIEISSTDFRETRDKTLLPEGVYEYIEERGLYR